MLCPNCRRENHSTSLRCDSCGAYPDPSPEGLGPPGAAPGWTPGPSAVAPGAFIGRQSELEQLRTALEDALSGQGRLVMLVGEPGIGKTRTLEELDDYGRGRQASVFWGRCYENPGAPPYWPWGQIIRSYIRDHDAPTLERQMGAGAADIAEIVAEVRELVPHPEQGRMPEDPDQARFRLFDSITNFCKNAAQEHPLVLFLDNLHWADKPSLLLLEFLAQEIAHERVLVVGTYRDIELSRRHPLSDSLAQLNRERLFRRVQLRGLSREDVGRFIQASAGVTPPADLVSAIHRQTEGNPLFINQVVRLLAEEGELAPHRLHSGRPLSINIPDGIKEAIGRRLNLLSESCTQTLAIASVLGREFRVGELERIVDHLPEERLLEVIDEAVATKVIEELPQGTDRYQFSHILIRETLYDELTGPRRARLNRRIGEALEQLYHSNLDPHLARLAYHFFEAASQDYAEKAVDYAARAGDRALALLAHEEAARYYQMALEAESLKQPADEMRRCRLLLSLGDAQKRSGDSESAREAFEQAAHTARRLGSPEHMAHAAMGFEEAGFRPGLFGAPAVRLLDEALSALPHGDNALTVRVLGSLSRALYLSGSLGRSYSVGQRAVEMARRTGDPSSLAWALSYYYYSRRGPEDLETRLSIAPELISLATTTSDTVPLEEVYAWHVFDLMETGDLQKTRALMAVFQQRAKQKRQPFYLYVGASCQASLAIAQGRFEEGEEMAKQALVIGRHIKGQDPTGLFGMKMFTIRREQGRLAELAPAVRLFVQQHAAERWRPGLALIYCELGLEAEARAEFEAMAAGDFGDIPQDALWVVCIAYLSEACTYLGDRLRAEKLYQLLAPNDGHNVVVGGGVAYLGAASRYLGQLAFTMGQWDLAQRHFRDALVMDAGMEARTWLAHTQYQYARLLLARNGPGEREEALRLLEQALSTASSLGMRSLEAQAGDLLEHTRQKSGREWEYPDGLSLREVEVLRLLATGMSNRDIAGELFITANTAANHVKNILAKTGSANRTEAAAYAMRHGLV